MQKIRKQKHNLIYIYMHIYEVSFIYLVFSLLIPILKNIFESKKKKKKNKNKRTKIFFFANYVYVMVMVLERQREF